jgi:hypothetical protein
MPSIATLERWSSRYGWVQRAHEYDAHVSEIVLKKQAETDAAERLHLRDLRLSRAEVVAGVATDFLVDSRTKRPREFRNITPQELTAAANAVRVAHAEERLDLAEPTERQDVFGEARVRYVLKLNLDRPDDE